MGGRIGNLCADSAQAHDAQLFSLYLTACKCFFALLSILSDIVIFRIGPAPLNAAHNIPGCHQHACNHQFLYAVGIGARCVEYHDSRLCAHIQRNVVHARARAADRL